MMIIKTLLGMAKQCLLVIGAIICIIGKNKNKKNKMLYLFGAPAQSNLGDNAQTYCIQCWCNEHLPDYEFFVFRYLFSTTLVLKTLRMFIHKDAILFCHSGYHITDLYNEKRAYCRLIELFPDYPITIFPQTVNFINKAEEKKIAGVFDSHPNLTLLCRDAVSYESAKNIFRRTKLLMYPDIVTTFIGKYFFSSVRNSILICKRNDKESLYNNEEIEGLIERLRKNIKVEITDTWAPIKYGKIVKKLREILEGVFDEYSRYQVVITDRYHGIIFSLIAGTPVIVLGSSDHKLSSGIAWFHKEVFGDYIAFAENLDAAFNMALNKINNPPKGNLPPYFKEKYYDVLLGKLSLGIN